MRARRLIPILADSAIKMIDGARRRKLGDYAAMLVGLAMISAMTGSPAVPDETTLGAVLAPTTPPMQASEPRSPEVTQPSALAVGGNGSSIPGPEMAPSLDLQEELATLQPQGSAAQAPTPRPTAEPARAVASSRSSRPTSTPAERFIAEHAEAARESMRATGVPASVTLAQGILESNSGQSLLSTKANNFFGIKARGKEGPAGVVYMDTWEHVGGKDVTQREPFRAYNNAAESFTDHGQYLRENKRYAKAFQHTDDAREFARQVHQAGYATDPNYASKLIKLMDRYDLYEFDG